MTPPSSISPSDLALARACAAACSQAYREATFQSDLAHALVIPANPELPAIVAFRGTTDIRDWLTDLHIGLASTIYGGIHSGFWRSARSVIPQILALPEPLILTGHSKGGAEAIICARLLSAAGHPVAAVITFGSPRTGDSAARAGYNSAPANPHGQTLGEITRRWIHEEDIVPRLPAWITGYRHVGQEYFLSSFGGVEISPPLWHKAASDLWGTFWGYKAGHLEQAADHPMIRYVEHLDSLLNQNQTAASI